ncbi:ATP-binding protein [Marinomonas colpomeniae]|uniref:histidine kinase n=1 Tax=Marinomonas colpomeniae TaxID=2774408 RepID=A0ABR8P2H2_9GAMM|nr:ATP-binding protein [Marinomonas colpomeniae]MBD5772476.1 HAMP domain-containing protein [Marinomonas colpomeniae]
MRISIFSKLFISLFVTSILLVISMSFLVGYSFKSGFQGYLNQQEKIKIIQLTSVFSEYYSEHNGWQVLRERPEIWGQIIGDPGAPFPVEKSRRFSSFHQEPKFHNPPSFHQNPDRPNSERLLRPPRNLPIQEELSPISHRIYLENTQGKWVVGAVPWIQNQKEAERLKEPILVDSKTVGWLVLQQKNLLSGPLVEQFYSQQKSNLYWIVGLAGLASLIVALCLVRVFLSPLKRLKQGATALSEGNYNVNFQIRSNDEFGELSDSFEYLVGSLKQQKENREQWLVDISHELRTPIAVLRSELEAIQDGIRQPEMRRMDSMHDQVMGLRRLVDDLYLLSKTDSGVYQMDTKTLDLAQLVERVVLTFEHRLQQDGLDLVFIKPEKLIFIKGDEKTLEQLLMNLLENSLRYTDAPGQIHLSIIEVEKDLVLRVEDSSPSVEKEHLPNLFKRLYRVDKSRSRQYGGSGLGLSICRNIVIMHGGEILASESELGGLAIDIRLKRE